MKIQLNADSIALVQNLTNQVSRANADIALCLRARKMRADVEEGLVPEPKELPLRSAQVSTFHLAGCTAVTAETQPERDLVFDLAEILIRARRDRLIAQLDAMGVVLTDQPDVGPAPTSWPGLSL